MDALVVFSPAKLNLFLAVTGRRPDGFHDLVSLVALLDFGDELRVEPAAAGRFTLACDRPELPVDERNLILRAARAFVARTGWGGGAAFAVHKRIPLGAGLGGGSSNAVATLQALNRLAGEPLDRAGLAAVAAELGSDCPLFLGGGPVVIRGRGERVEPLEEGAAARLAGRRVLLFKPAFGIDTPWAYRRLAEQQGATGDAYLAPAEAERRLAAWRGEPTAPAEALLFNSLERAAFDKFIALPALLARLEREHGWQARMSGSGSACFGFVPEDRPLGPLQATIRAAWGETALQIACRVRSAPNPS